MPLRERSYRSFLDNHLHRQNGEGRCWPALLEAARRSAGDFSWDADKIMKELGGTKRDGVDSREVVAFFEKLGIPWYAESDCGEERFMRLLGELSPGVDIFTSVWDCRFRPGYRPKDDKPEVHIVAPLEAICVDGYPWIISYDPDTEIGGLFPVPLGLWMMWWHEGPDSKPGVNREVTKKDIDRPSRRFFLATGATNEEVWRMIGEPNK